MVEAFGIAASAIGIAAAFTAVVDCFEYVQAGRYFRRDYQTSQLKLTLLRLRLSRWGQAVDIYGDPQLGNPSASRAEVQAAKDTIFQILVLFDSSNKIAAKFRIKADAGAAPPPAEGANVADVADVAVLAVDNRMRQLAQRRQKGASLLKLTSWAVHHSTALKTLLDDISELVDNLEALFPAPRERRQQLAKEEASGVPDQQEMLALASASRDVDPVLHEVVSKVAGHKYRNIDIDGGKDASVLEGNYFAADYEGGAPQGAWHSFDGIKIKGTEGLVVMHGDRYGGSDPFSRR